MGWSHILYKTSHPTSLSNWDSDLSSPIATPEEVKKRLSLLFDISDWHRGDSLSPSEPTAYHYALGNNNCDPNGEYIDLTIIENSDGFIHMISARKSSPKVLRVIMEEFSLNNAIYDQTLEAVDPYRYGDDWTPLPPQ